MTRSLLENVLLDRKGVAVSESVPPEPSFAEISPVSEAVARSEEVSGNPDVDRWGSISGGYASYSLFLMTNLEWLGELDEPGLQRLHATYRTFGELIGSDHLAVWFWQKVPPDSETSQAHVTKNNIDIRRSADYAKAYNLPVNQGPYVVLMQTHPQETRRRTDVSLFRVRLDKLPPHGVASLLNALAGAVMESNLIEEVASKEEWLRFVARATGAGKALGRLLERVELTFKSPFGELKVGPAKG